MKKILAVAVVLICATAFTGLIYADNTIVRGKILLIEKDTNSIFIKGEMQFVVKGDITTTEPGSKSGPIKVDIASLEEGRNASFTCFTGTSQIVSMYVYPVHKENKSKMMGGVVVSVDKESNEVIIRDKSDGSIMEFIVIPETIDLLDAGKNVGVTYYPEDNKVFAFFIIYRGTIVSMDKANNRVIIKDKESSQNITVNISSKLNKILTYYKEGDYVEAQVTAERREQPLTEGNGMITQVRQEVGSSQYSATMQGEIVSVNSEKNEVVMKTNRRIAVSPQVISFLEEGKEVEITLSGNNASSILELISGEIVSIDKDKNEVILKSENAGRSKKSKVKEMTFSADADTISKLDEAVSSKEKVLIEIKCQPGNNKIESFVLEDNK